ncbi:NAD-binding protein [Phellopilus nigrolimitatus]|nr:NAD-binding protein [Phellopilus nigrolimitatus]
MSPPSIPTTSRVVVLQNHIGKAIDFSDSSSGTFTVKEVPIVSPLPDDSLLVQTLYTSNDPVQRLWTSPVGSPMAAFTLSRVVKVGGEVKEGESVKVGDLVDAQTQWADYTVVKKDKVKVVEELPGLSPSIYLGVLGFSGLTAYFGLESVLKPKKTDTLVVSGAAGAVGNVVVQYAKKVLGVKRVVGIAGSEKKCEWLKSIGADAAVNYKSATFTEDLAKATPDKVDGFFDNVGGAILDEVIMRMNVQGHICACGAISTYTDHEKGMVLKNYMTLIVNRLTITGITVFGYMVQFEEGQRALADTVISGKLVVDGAETLVDVQGKLEELPRIWAGLFESANTGKSITKLAA